MTLISAYIKLFILGEDSGAEMSGDMPGYPIKHPAESYCRKFDVE